MTMATFTRSVCILLALVAVEATSAATANIMVLKPETCGNSNGEMYAYMSGSGSVDLMPSLDTPRSSKGTVTAADPPRGTNLTG